MTNAPIHPRHKDEALALSGSLPVAWMYEHPTWLKCVYLEKQDMSRLSAAMVETPLYATPQPAAVGALVEALRSIADAPAVHCAREEAAWGMRTIARQALAQIERKPDVDPR